MKRMDLLFSMLQIAGGIITACCYIPQIAKIMTTRSVQDFSLSTYILLFIGISFMESYAVYLAVTSANGMAFLITNTLSLLIVGVMCALILRFRDKRDGRK